eukprot:g22445.t1
MRQDPGDRTEVDLRNLRVRAAEAWIELGCAERADQELKAFIGKFRHLVYDCELDYKRLSAHSANLKDTQNTAAAPVLALEELRSCDPQSGLLWPGNGIVEVRSSYSASAKTSQSREGIIQAARAVELCEMIITNRRLVSVRNPVKRRLVRDLAMTSLCTGVDARLWKVVFKHLRLLCDSNDSDHLLALFSRILFTHADVEGNTYAAAFTDVRGWALRRLLRRPRDFGLTLLCAHFCIIASQYPYAVAEYSRAHRLAPFEPLPALCTATAYISFSMSRAAVWRWELVWAKQLASIQGDVLRRQPWEENVLTDPMDHLAIRAEVAYNYGRAFHQLSMSTFAVEAYEAALSCFEGAQAEPFIHY